MTDLAGELAHARAMAKANHKPECIRREHPWTKPTPTPGCTGCVTDADRRLWQQLADEYQAHLDRHREDTLL
jgi:hypothetical protein